MKKYLITYSDNEILTISEAPTQGVIACGTNMAVTTLDDAIIMFSALAFDVSNIEDMLEIEDMLKIEQSKPLLLN